MRTQGCCGRLPVGRFGSGTVAHFQQPGQVLPGSEPCIYARFHISGWVGVGQVVLFQLRLPGEQIRQAAQLFAELQLVGADHSFCLRDLCLQAWQAFAPTLQRFFQNRVFLQLRGVIDLSQELLTCLPQTTGFRLLLIQQAACTSRTGRLCFHTLLDQFRSSPGSQMLLRLRCFYQLLQALTRHRIAGMVKAGQPQALASGPRQADPRQLIPQLHTVIHPTEGSFRVARAGGTDRLADEIQIKHNRRPAPQQIVHHTRNEGLAKGSDHSFHRTDRFLIAGLQRPTDPTVVSKASLSPGARYYILFRHRLGAIVQILQMFHATQDPSEKFLQLALRCKRSRLLPDR
jgi:hypothetical protein